MANIRSIIFDDKIYTLKQKKPKPLTTIEIVSRFFCYMPSKPSPQLKEEYAKACKKLLCEPTPEVVKFFEDYRNLINEENRKSQPKEFLGCLPIELVALMALHLDAKSLFFLLKSCKFLYAKLRCDKTIEKKIEKIENDLAVKRLRQQHALFKIPFRDLEEMPTLFPKEVPTLHL